MQYTAWEIIVIVIMVAIVLWVGRPKTLWRKPRPSAPRPGGEGQSGGGRRA
jgi:hypothetical protein